MKKFFTHKLCLCGIALILGFFALPVYSDAVPANFFPIAVWMEASPEIMGYDASTAATFFETSFKKMVTFGFNTVRPSNLPHQNKEIVEQFMTLARQYNLMVILDPGEGHNLMKFDSSHLQKNRSMWLDYLGLNIIGRFYRYPNLLGYALIDEPAVYQIRDANNNPIDISQEETLARWGLISEMLEELDPEHHEYTVFNDPAWLSMAVNSSSRKAIAYDNYPFETKVPDYVMGPAGEYNWYTRLQAFNEACQAQFAVAQLSVIQTFEDNLVPYRYPKPEELRACVYTSLAAGARGIMFFLFMDMISPNGDYAHGLLDASFHVNNRDLIKAVVALNQELQILGPWLALLQSATNGKVSGWEQEAKVLWGEYVNTLGVKYYIMANKDPNPNHGAITHSIQLPASDYYVTDKYSLEKFQADAHGWISITLGAGQGRVLRESNTRPITVSSPETGAKWYKGFVYPINWYSTGLKGNIAIELLSNSSAITITDRYPLNAPPFNYQVPTDLEPGNYYIKISQDSLSGQTENFVIAEPSTTAIELDSSLFQFTGLPGDVFTCTFRVRHGDTGTLRYYVTDDKPWIKVYPSRGVSAGEYDTIRVTIDPIKLPDGYTYNGTITVSGNEVMPKTISVQLRVNRLRLPDFDNFVYSGD